MIEGAVNLQQCLLEIAFLSSVYNATDSAIYEDVRNRCFPVSGSRTQRDRLSKDLLISHIYSQSVSAASDECLRDTAPLRITNHRMTLKKLLDGISLKLKRCVSVKHLDLGRYRCKEKQRYAAST